MSLSHKIMAKRNNDFNQDLIDCIDYFLKEQGKNFWLSQDIFKNKWGKQRGTELHTFLSYNQALDTQGTKLRIIIPQGIRLREEAGLRIISQEQNKIIQEQNKAIKLQTHFIFISLIVASVSLIIAGVVGGYNIYSINKQITLIDKQIESISPLKPTIEVSLDIPKDGKIPVWDLAKIRKYPDGSEDFEKMEVRFILSNIGRMRTGFINAYLRSSFTHSPSQHIDNILGESASFLEFEVWYNKCFEESKLIKLVNGSEIPKHPINPECNFRLRKVPLGRHEFNLTLDCPFCLDSLDKEKIYHFKLCIFDETDASIKICSQEP